MKMKSHLREMMPEKLRFFTNRLLGGWNISKRARGNPTIHNAYASFQLKCTKKTKTLFFATISKQFILSPKDHKFYGKTRKKDQTISINRFKQKRSIKKSQIKRWPTCSKRHISFSFVNYQLKCSVKAFLSPGPSIVFSFSIRSPPFMAAIISSFLGFNFLRL